MFQPYFFIFVKGSEHGTLEQISNNPLAYSSDKEYLDALKRLAVNYGDLPMDSQYKAFFRAVGQPQNPFIQNTRVKHISSFPVDFNKDQIADFIKSPQGNEMQLRQASHALNWAAQPYANIVRLYQKVTTFRHYHYTPYISVEEAKTNEYARENRLISKLAKELNIDDIGHRIVGQTVLEGKVAYVPRISIDKTHNSVNYAFMQQLPSDWYKIIGFNNISGYTVSFNMMYFITPGADWTQFGDLFKPYIKDFYSIADELKTPVRDGGKYVYAEKTGVGAVLEKAKGLKSRPDVYSQDGRWAYWVTLPVEKVWVFEADDTDPTVAPPFAGLFLALDQMAALEEIQLSLVQNPLVSVVLGEIPYKKDEPTGAQDPYQLSNAGRMMFLSYWYDMMSAANTSGIGAYFAPVENLHLETLAEAPNATNISTAGYSYAMQKSGLSGLIPITDDPRAGSIATMASIEERYMLPVVKQLERMVNVLFKGLNLRYEWRFKVLEGGFQKDETIRKNAKEALNNGITSALYEYLAIEGKDICDAMGQAAALEAVGIFDTMRPLVTSYTMKQESSGLPPQPKGDPGRPETDIQDVMSGDGTEGQESSIDSGR